VRGPKTKYADSAERVFSIIVLAAPAVYLKGVLEFSIHVISSGIRSAKNGEANERAVFRNSVEVGTQVEFDRSFIERRLDLEFFEWLWSVLFYFFPIALRRP